MPVRIGQEIQAVSRPPELRRLDVVAGILEDADGRVLITERVGGGPFHGLWEFPGGKIRRGESPLSALVRELGEEIGIEALDTTHFISLQHDYPDRSVSIDFYLVPRWRKEPQGLEGQALDWVKVADIDAAILLPANLPVVDALRTRLANA